MAITEMVVTIITIMAIVMARMEMVVTIIIIMAIIMVTTVTITVLINRQRTIIIMMEDILNKIRDIVIT